jgi:hypothetical protein
LQALGRAQRFKAAFQARQVLCFKAIRPHGQKCRPKHRDTHAERQDVVASAFVYRVGHIGCALLHRIELVLDFFAGPAGKVSGVGGRGFHVHRAGDAGAQSQPQSGDENGLSGTQHDGRIVRQAPQLQMHAACLTHDLCTLF